MISTAGDAERLQMRDDRRFGERRRTARAQLGDVVAQPGEAAHVEFVEDRVLPGDARASGLAAAARARRIWGERARVGAELEHRRVQRERPVDRAGVGVDEQLGRRRSGGRATGS